MEDYDRLYSDSAGRTCNPDFSTPLGEAFECSSPYEERGDACWMECSEHCDDFKDCAAFTIDGTSCTLWETCDIIMGFNPMAESSNTFVCLENCPEDTQPWYSTGGFIKCSAKDKVGVIELPCTPEGEGFDPRCDVRGICADICLGTFFCTNFQVTFEGGNKCTLYDDCKEKDVDGNGSIGYIRCEVVPVWLRPATLGLSYRI